MLDALIVGCGGFLGALARHLLAAAVQTRVDAELPLGTLVVNALGCVALGALMARSPSTEWRLFLGVGLLGGFTTMSTFGNETLALAREAGLGPAALNAGLNLGLALFGSWLGWALAGAGGD